jgi:hypothetical protein
VSSFIEKYGTHIIVGLSMGGQDVVYVKQDRSSPLSPSVIKEHLDKLGDQLFTGTCTLPPSHCKSRDHKFKVKKKNNNCTLKHVKTETEFSYLMISIVDLQ